MGYLIAAYSIFVGFTALYVVALIARRRRTQAELDELRVIPNGSAPER